MVEIKKAFFKIVSICMSICLFVGISAYPAYAAPNLRVNLMFDLKEDGHDNRPTKLLLKVKKRKKNYSRRDFLKYGFFSVAVLPIGFTGCAPNLKFMLPQGALFTPDWLNAVFAPEWLNLVISVDKFENELREGLIDRRTFFKKAGLVLEMTRDASKHLKDNENEMGAILFKRRLLAFVVKETLDRSFLIEDETEKERMVDEISRNIRVSDIAGQWEVRGKHIVIPKDGLTSIQNLEEDSNSLVHEVEHLLDYHYMAGLMDGEIHESIDMLRAEAMESEYNKISYFKPRISPWHMYPTSFAPKNKVIRLTQMYPSKINYYDDLKMKALSFRELIRLVEKKVKRSSFPEFAGDTYNRAKMLCCWAEGIRKDILREADKGMILSGELFHKMDSPSLDPILSDAAWFSKHLFLEYITRSPFKDGLDPARAEIAGRSMAIVYKALYDDVAALTEKKFPKSGVKLTDEERLKMEKRIRTLLRKSITEAVVEKVRHSPIDEKVSYEAEGGEKTVHSWVTNISNDLISGSDVEDLANRAVKIKPDLWSTYEIRTKTGERKEHGAAVPSSRLKVLKQRKSQLTGSEI